MFQIESRYLNSQIASRIAPFEIESLTFSSTSSSRSDHHWTLPIVNARPSVHVAGPGHSPLSVHFPISSPPHLLLYLIVFFSFPFFLSYSLHLFSCFSIPPHSTRIVPLRLYCGVIFLPLL